MMDLKRTVARQIWILDDSGSMMTCDGHVLMEDVNRETRHFVKCSRWEELQQCVCAHIKVSGALRFPTSIRVSRRLVPTDVEFCLASSPEEPFQLLNRGERGLGICLQRGSDVVQQEVQHCLNVIGTSSPSAGTPLKRHIFEIRQEVEAIKPALIASGKSVSVIICTDGEPTDASREEFINELRLFRDLPVSIVVRLCTDEENIVKYYVRKCQANGYGN
jgi:hypothetical protein